MKDDLIGQQTIIVPVGADPDQAAIVLGADLPSCLAAVYGSALLFRPDGSVSTSNPYVFIGQDAGGGTQLVRIGAMVYDGAAVCGTVAFQQIEAMKDVGGPAHMSIFLRTGRIQETGSGAWVTGVIEDFDNYIATYDGTTTVNIDGALTNGAESMLARSTWVPVLTQVTTNPTAGFDTTTGQYRRQGDITHFRISTVIADATKAGTGAYQWTLPFDAAIDLQAVAAFANDVSVGADALFPCVGRVTSTGAGSVRMHSTSGARVSQAAPFAVANGDIYVIEGSYFCV